MAFLNWSYLTQYGNVFQFSNIAELEIRYKKIYGDKTANNLYGVNFTSAGIS